jgi:hypothetical protein
LLPPTSVALAYPSYHEWPWFEGLGLKIVGQMMACLASGSLLVVLTMLEGYLLFSSNQYHVLNSHLQHLSGANDVFVCPFVSEFFVVVGCSTVAAQVMDASDVHQFKACIHRWVVGLG